MKIAIVGSSHLAEDETRKARIQIIRLLENKKEEFGDYLTIISGEAAGIDTIAKESADLLEIKYIPFKPKRKMWKYYKERNILIAKNCDQLYNFVIYEPNAFCWHCKDEKNVKPHIQSGGCFTYNIALGLKKQVNRIFV